MTAQRIPFVLVRPLFRRHLMVAMFVAILAGVVGTLTTVARADQKAVTDARKKLTEAQAAQKTATDAYAKAKDAVVQKTLASPEGVAAKDALTKAKADYDAAAKPVIEKSHDGTSYKSAKVIFDGADAKLKARQLDPSGGSISGDELTKLTTTRATARQSMEKAETDALAGDAAVQSAKTTLDSAQAALTELTKKAEAAVADDADCTTAKKALDDAEKDTADARTALAAAVKQAAADAKNSRGGSGGARGGAGGIGSGGGGGGGRGGR